jgi:serine protease AprX
MERLVACEVVARSDRGVSLELGPDGEGKGRPDAPSAERLQQISERLAARGFAIGIAGPHSISILAPMETYRSAIGATFDGPQSSGDHRLFAAEDRSLFRPEGDEWADVQGFVRVPTATPSQTGDHLAKPRAGPKPKVPYYHIEAPHDLVTHLNARHLHERGIDGRGVHICVVDTGCWKHPWFSDRGLHVDVVMSLGASHPELDEVGHGTMVCASVMSLAPRAKVTLVKQVDDDTTFPAFKHAISMKPQIIQNVWGTIIDGGPLPAAQNLVAETLRHAIDEKIVVIFAGGNQKKLFPQQMPEAIAVGGVFVSEAHEAQAATYASGYESTLYPGRIVPDFCGLVGMGPEGVYIMMPTMPGSVIDSYFAGKSYPEGDGTEKPDDGWVVISGTSSASGQISGVAALLMQERPHLDQAQVRKILSGTARPILKGNSFEGNPAGLPVPNLATGYGLVDAAAAVRSLHS